MSLSFFHVDAGYCDFLRKADARVPFTQGDKSARPFVGVLLEINEMKYYAPLSSPKPKHLKMGNQLDFLKIDGGKLGAINFNNMIPVHKACLTIANLTIGQDDGRDERAYKNLLADQLSWCNRSRNEISARAMKLYGIIVSGAGKQSLRNRCCDFKGVENRYVEYCAENGLTV